MKKRIPTFVAGMITTAIIGGLGMTALAATGQLTLTVDPVNIQVNGTTFAPKDAQGNSVPVFALNGTTYAPLRALAEAYGLEVGYDKGSNMATVGEKATFVEQPDAADKKAEKGLVTVADGNTKITINDLEFKHYSCTDWDYMWLYNGNLSGNEVKELWGAYDSEQLKSEFQTAAIQYWESVGSPNDGIRFLVEYNGSGTNDLRLALVNVTPYARSIQCEIYASPMEYASDWY